jgi:DMSO reductase anchor subunit
VTKLNNYEDSYKNRITEARRKELLALKKEHAVWALTLVITVISPVVATAATFFLYVLSDETHVLTASRSFTVLLLFLTLRFPISYAGRLLGST